MITFETAKNGKSNDHTVEYAAFTGKTPSLHSSSNKCDQYPKLYCVYRMGVYGVDILLHWQCNNSRGDNDTKIRMFYDDDAFSFL